MRRPARERTPEQLTRIVVLFVVVTILVNTATFCLLGLLTMQALDGVRTNTARIEANAYRQCADLNRGFVRSNAVIESAITAELAKPDPDRKRLADLRDFRLPVRECGPKP
jgi:hypothetical protein